MLAYHQIYPFITMSLKCAEILKQEFGFLFFSFTYLNSSAKIKIKICLDPSVKTRSVNANAASHAVPCHAKSNVPPCPSSGHFIVRLDPPPGCVAKLGLPQSLPFGCCFLRIHIYICLSVYLPYKGETCTSGVHPCESLSLLGKAPVGPSLLE